MSGSGGSSNPGSGGNTSGSGGTTSGSGGGTSNPGHPGCDVTVVAQGVDSMIDDFNHSEMPLLPSVDGREGEWSHGTWVSPTGVAPEFPFESGDSGPKYMRLACNGGSGQEWCDTAWDSTNPWQQWAAAATVLGDASGSDVSCHDASLYTGIRFEARSGQGGDTLLLQVRTPDADVDLGEVHNSAEIPLGSGWDTYTVPFSQIRQPIWSSVTAPLDVRALISFAFVVRTVEQFGVTPPLDGEVLKPYDIHIDNVEFY